MLHTFTSSNINHSHKPVQPQHFNKDGNKMRTIRTKVYQFNELTETAQQKAIEWALNAGLNTDYEWYDEITGNFKENEDYFTITNTYFSGFYSQGDGAMFEYSGINKTFVDTIIDSLKLPNWKKEVLKHCIYVSGNGKQSGHYYHHKSVSHNIYVEADNGAQNYSNIEALIELYTSEIEAAIIEKYEDMAKELYKSLEKEYDYLCSKEAIEETILANEYEFKADGTRF